MNRFVAWSALFATAVFPLGATPASAATPEDPTDEPGRMMLVLDSSGSMKERAGGGQTKIDAAKKSLTDVIASLPDDQDVGLRVFGATVFSADDKGACTDSQRVVDAGTDNRDELVAAVKDYKPYGETPTGYALKEAGKDLGTEGRRTIVLVSDGEPTCDPDPCKVAADLSKSGIDLRIDVVGLDVSGKARDQLRCIADRGNGTYYDVDDAAGLTESLDTSTTRASRPFDLTGEPVTGTPQPDGSPQLSTGQFLDTLSPDGEELYYQIPRSAPGSTIHVGIIHGAEPGTAGSGARATIYARDTEDAAEAKRCNDASTHTATIGERRPFSYAAATSWNKSTDDLCNTADSVILGIQTSSGNLGGQPVEIAVYEEPPLADGAARDLPPTPEAPEWTTLTPGTSVDDVVPGTSIANAPVVEDGTYAFDINPGETQVVAVPLDWGQDLQAQLDATLTDAVLDAAAVGSSIEVDVIGPLRSGATLDRFGNEPDDWFTTALGNAWLNDERDFRTGAQTPTIAYLNRAEGSIRTGSDALPGLHYVRVRHNVRGDDANLPYTLTIQRNGTAGEGAPTYEESGDIVAPAAESRLTVPEQVKSDAPAADSSSDIPWLPIVLGAAGLLALAAAGAILLRRRRQSA